MRRSPAAGCGTPRPARRDARPSPRPATSTAGRRRAARRASPPAGSRPRADTTWPPRRPGPARRGGGAPATSPGSTSRCAASGSPARPCRPGCPTPGPGSRCGCWSARRCAARTRRRRPRRPRRTSTRPRTSSPSCATRPCRRRSPARAASGQGRYFPVRSSDYLLLSRSWSVFERINPVAVYFVTARSNPDHPYTTSVDATQRRLTTICARRVSPSQLVIGCEAR